MSSFCGQSIPSNVKYTEQFLFINMYIQLPLHRVKKFIHWSRISYILLEINRVRTWVSYKTDPKNFILPPGRVVSSRAPALSTSYSSLCPACGKSLAHRPKPPTLANSVEHSKTFRVSAHHTVNQNISFILSGFPLSQFTLKLL